MYFRVDTAEISNECRLRRGSSLVKFGQARAVHPNPTTQQARSDFRATQGNSWKYPIIGAHPLSTMSESPYLRNPGLSRPAFTGRVSSPLSRPHFPWTTYLQHRPPSASPAPTGASANWDSASTVSNTSQTYTRNPSAIVPQYNEETNMRQWTFTVCLSIMMADHRGPSTHHRA